MTAAVYVSFPVSPDAYPANPDWHAQLCFFVFQALRQRFGDRVVFYPWDTPPPLRSADALVTFLPHPALVHHFFRETAAQVSVRMLARF